jgi:hypothetical protein
MKYFNHKTLVSSSRDWLFSKTISYREQTDPCSPISIHFVTRCDIKFLKFQIHYLKYIGLIYLP